MEQLLLQRAQDAIVRDELAKALTSKTPLRVKLGIDPTGPRLHLGRTSTLRRVRQLQDLGHQVSLIIGDFTATIGDSSDKTSERQPLTAEEIKANMTGYVEQLGKILDMDKVELSYNSEWFNKLGLSSFIELAQQFTVAQMIERENFSLRYKEQRPIGLHEFLYPILQGYDSVEVKADLEIGGTDQLFNLMAGRVIQKHYGQKPQFVMTFELLEGTDGRKMSTSWGNAIYMEDAPADMFGKLMSINDESIAHYYRVCTDVNDEVLKQVITDIANGANPRDTKASLAREIVTIYHGEQAATEAEAAFNRLFRDKTGPTTEDIETVDGEDADIVSFLESNLAISRSEVRRLITGGGVKVDGKAIDSFEHKVKAGELISARRRHLKIKS